MHGGDVSIGSYGQRPAVSVCSRSRSRSRGFTYIAVLVALLLLSLAANGVMSSVSQQAQREREAELLRIGQAYVQAIGRYYEASPGSVKGWPQKLEDLLDDQRTVSIQRHLRTVYPDPMTRQADWDLLRTTDGGIKGLRSRSARAPIRTGTVVLDQLTLAPASRYSDWTFEYQPAQAPLTPMAPLTAGAKPP